ncbi:nitroreductase family protein [Agromyces archimandritae]|uniref:Nitroreductase family protein n=1 Tax=Agromyces archimandritae TaxID=2781962 RepID=A0A975FL33_9MICO|nr:nitroreductase family protein [Agromyces archimandritae]QTX04074.1 nitroreductase family protein [Agromyces archimandritae]
MSDAPAGLRPTRWDAVPPGTAATAYASLILNRVADGMPGDEQPVDWDHAPLTGGFAPDAPIRLLPLPEAGRGLLADRPAATLQTITDLCHIADGIAALRLSVNLNDRPEVHTLARSAKWGRTTASGGGRYTADLWLVQGAGGDLAPGIHRYSHVHNGWEQLDGHDRTEEVRAAIGDERAAHRYLVTTIDYWQSAFKYHDFAYQATAMDAGTLFGTFHRLVGDDVAGTWNMTLDEPALAAVLGIDARDDGVYAVQAWPAPDAAGGAPATRPDRGAPAAAAGLPVPVPVPAAGAYPIRRGAHRPQRFPTTLALQRDHAASPPPTRAVARTLAPVLTPDADRAARIAALAARETSFGRFTGEAVAAGAVRAALEAGAAAARALAGGTVRFDALVSATAVDGLPAGLHLWRDGRFERLDPEPQDAFLASTYFLQNYDGRRAAATVVLCANVFELAERDGVRGYRLANAAIGAGCQALLAAATEAGIGSGTALGFDARAHAEHAGLDLGETSPLLMIMLGRDDPRAGRLDVSATTIAAASGPRIGGRR